MFHLYCIIKKGMKRRDGMEKDGKEEKERRRKEKSYLYI